MNTASTSENPPTETLKSPNSMQYTHHKDDQPKLAETLHTLHDSTTLQCKNFTESIEATSDSIAYISQLSVSQLQEISENMETATQSIENVVNSATIFCLKCNQLEKELSKLDAFELQLKDIKQLLPIIEKLVAQVPLKE